ncbi:EAL domain-containing protein [Lacimicrobium sp. SS2-24]|uniref:EAL domain-containing protein n=1 Tax=Lacimicrobium sp. SS2-24 TaxID=2005569 RepID=UPI001AEF79F6|nr:EAL domain-containing protein [Lacimicrobium sp. SS2-24]
MHLLLLYFRRLRRYATGMMVVGCLLTLVPVAVADDDSITLRVGVYENPPKLFTDEQGQLSGILGDLLSEIARREGWQLEPVVCHWDQCLQWVQHGKIDLLPDVAWTESRAQRMDYHQVPALMSWSQLYGRQDQKLSSLLDLQDKRVSVLLGSVQQSYLENLVSSFELRVSWVTEKSLEDSFRAVSEGRADVVASNQYIGARLASQLNLTPSPVMFLPNKLFYVVPPGQHSDILSSLDGYLQRWKQDHDSPYFSILEKWSSTPPGELPRYLWWLIAALLSGLLLTLVISHLLRQRVTRIGEHLRASEARLTTILNGVDAFIFIKDKNYRYQYVNQKVSDLFGLPEKKILGCTDEAFFDAQTCEALHEVDVRVLESGEQVTTEETDLMADGVTELTCVSVKLPLKDAQGNIYALCGIATDITQYRQAQKELHQLAYFDSLTELPNRRLLLDRLHQALVHAKHSGSEGAILLIDLDNFKTLNDTRGHAAGDLLLREVAQRLGEGLHGKETLGRLSADEFVLVLEGLGKDMDRAVELATRQARAILQKLSQPYQLDEQGFSGSASIGVVMFSDANGSVESLLKEADLALCDAKDAGRNTLRFYNPVMQTKVNHQSQLEAALRLALEDDNLQLYLQPQYDADRQVFAMEALLRWQDPELGWVSPGDFIPVAEASGQIVPLGEWVMMQACRILADWDKQNSMKGIRLAVNISARQFYHPHFVEHVRQCISQTGIEPKYLELEITESLLIDDLENTINKMNLLRSMGISFSLDDFGTGYASLAYLKRLPLSSLKIDQTFVAELLSDPNDEAIVSTIVALGNSLELGVIAEGVETQQQAQRLEQLGCKAFQGYYFARPAPVEHWAELAEKGQL